MEQLQAFYKGKNVLVTGGAGFIGSHIAQELCSYGALVTVIDDLSTGSLDNISSFCSNITLIARDISSYKACMKATKNKNIIFHTAAFVSVPQSIKQPALCEKINVYGTQNLLEACKINKVPTFIFSSSASVYGEKENKCFENDLPSPQSPYAKSKLEGEKLCKTYAKEHKIKTASLRYFNVYGERQNAHSQYAGVVAKFKYNLSHGKPIVIYGDGKQKRDFIHVSEVVKANLLIGMLQNLYGDIFNIATGTSITLLEILKKLEKEIAAKPVKIVFKPARKGDIYCSLADCKKYSTIKRKLL